MATIPRISLITPSFQQAAFLAECLDSVAAQDYPALEHLVVDGGSTDGSKPIIEQRASRLAWWVSEKDGGQSHALNKGLAHATGEVFGWLNSDDLLLPGTLLRAGRAFAENPGLVVFGGRSMVRDAAGDHLPSRTVDASNRSAFLRDPGFDQPSTFFRMEAVKAIGGLETKLRFVMDLELLLQLAFRYGTEHMKFIPDALAVARMHADCKSVKEFTGFESERASLLHGLCTLSGNADLAGILELGYQLLPGLRPIPAGPEHHGLVRDMTVYFLLKWNHRLHRRPQFQMMRAFRQRIGLEGLPMEPLRNERLANLDAELRVPGWWAFRLRRKWRHLKGR
jgi:glycosyltransferase involved in cell wall biosynthesis